MYLTTKDSYVRQMGSITLK